MDLLQVKQKNLLNRPVTGNYGLLSMNCGLLWSMVPVILGLIDFP